MFRLLVSTAILLALPSCGSTLTFDELVASDRRLDALACVEEAEASRAAHRWFVQRLGRELGATAEIEVLRDRAAVCGDDPECLAERYMPEVAAGVRVSHRPIRTPVEFRALLRQDGDALCDRESHFVQDIATLESSIRRSPGFSSPSGDTYQPDRGGQVIAAVAGILTLGIVKLRPGPGRTVRRDGSSSFEDRLVGQVCTAYRCEELVAQVRTTCPQGSWCGVALAGRRDPRAPLSLGVLARFPDGEHAYVIYFDRVPLEGETFAEALGAVAGTPIALDRVYPAVYRDSYGGRRCPARRRRLDRDAHRRLWHPHRVR